MHKSETHRACAEIIERDGGKAVCCDCNGHKCKPTTPTIEESILALMKERDSRMWDYYKLVFTEDYELGYPAEYDTDMVKGILEHIAAEVGSALEEAKDWIYQ